VTAVVGQFLEVGPRRLCRRQPLGRLSEEIQLPGDGLMAPRQFELKFGHGGVVISQLLLDGPRFLVRCPRLGHLLCEIRGSEAARLDKVGLDVNSTSRRFARFSFS
jgi:hypothetical protein